MNMRSSVVLMCASGVLALLALGTPLVSSADVAVSITVAPPALPIYEQPPLPTPGYIWTPGYWAYGPDGYFWVPGTWVEPPAVGFLWTPGYWGWSNGVFVWTPGFWATEVGFYGGIDYGFGYPGRGYAGGYWRGNDFYYNRVVNNVTNVNVRNVYTQNVTNVTVNQVSYVGGPGGLKAQPTAQEQQIARGAHRPPTSAQTQHRDGASSQRELLASVNHGKPPIPATQRPGEFSAHPQATAGNAHGAPAKSTSSTSHPAAPIHASELPKPTPSPAAAPSASATEQAAAHQQAQLQARQEQERAALERQQTQDHASYSQQKSANQQAYAAMERQHQQQTQQLQQRQTQERQAAEKPPQQARSAHEPQQPEHHPGG